MKKIILLKSFFLISTITFSQTISLTSIIKKVENSVFIIYTYDKNNKPLSQGSGFFIEDNGIGITNFHVLEDAKSAIIKLKNGKEYKIKNIIDFDSKIDIVKFQIENTLNKSFSHLIITKSSPRVGESIFNISNPLGFEQTVSNGIISSFREIPPHGNMIQITAPISQGSSGSPIFNLKGEVIGVATLGYKMGQNLNFAISFKEINNLNNTLNQSLTNISKNMLETKIYEKAKSEYIDGNLLIAIDILKEELKYNKTNHLALNLKGRIETDIEDYENAIESLFYAIELDSTSKDYFNNFGVANAKYGYKIGGDYDSMITALSAYDKAIEIDENYDVAYFNKAYIIYNNIYNLKEPIIESKSIYEALNNLNNALEINPEYASAYSLRAKIKYKLKDNWAAIEDINKAISIEPNNFEFYFTRGEIKSFGLKDYKNAIYDLNEAIKLTDSKTRQADILGLCSITKSLDGQNNEACNDAKKAYQLDPKQIYTEMMKKLCNN